MPAGLDGQWNIAGLQVPGVYVDIIPPSPNLVGAPTNVIGLVGVGSWGTVNAVTYCSTPTDAGYKIGPPKVRSYDMSTYISAGINVGGAAQFACVRVTDGTDVAATATIQSILALTAKHTGTLGNSLTFQAAAGTAIGSYTFTIGGFPGSSAEIFQNVPNGIGYITTTAGTLYTSVPSAIVAAPASGRRAIIQPTLSIYGAQTVVAGGTSGFVVGDLLTFSNGVVLAVASVSSGVVATTTLTGGAAGSIAGGPVPTNPLSMISTNGAGVGTPTVNVHWGLGAPNIIDPGAGYVLSPTITLYGGGGSGGSYVATVSPWLGLANAINNGNATRGPSNYVVANALTGSAPVPTLGTAVTLSGGSDGATGVTDATLIGADTLPRSGMYVLRGVGTAAFGACDLSTAALWPAMDAFALSELTLNCVATVSGDSITGAAATRVSVGLDDEWTWITVGDWPTFYDATNKLSRLISPVAFMLAIIGNQSPEQSPLNKVLRGISATQKTMSGLPYADADLQVLNTSGIDLIAGPPTTVGGDYFAFASGRNASSNTAAQGVEYTTLTNFLARTAQQFAVASLEGKLQSIKPTDQTRQTAENLFNGVSAFLASPASGSGGNGIIDTWSVQCDLNNNPPATQALGYLFIYWTVRYLNVVRYIVVKLAGGGNVTVTVQNTVPTPAQFLNS